MADASDGVLVLNASVAHTSGYFSEADNVVRQPAYVVVDVSAEWRPGEQHPSLRLWVRNVGDTEYSESLVTFPTAAVLQKPAAPRRFGASISYDF